MASRMFDLPEPLRPVIALNASSKPSITVLWPYDLKPSMTIDLMCILMRQASEVTDSDFGVPSGRYPLSRIPALFDCVVDDFSATEFKGCQLSFLI